ncbi:MAG TPA: tyrosine-type recombinase/integrase [Opitutales bacterium]|nr:tyrosine-type recombinase/integrase [Opitutales bacterium]
MKTTKSSPAQAGYTRVAECLFRHDSSGTYYALIKRSGKQIRRSLKTKDRKLAERRLADFRDKVERLDLTNGKAKVTFADLAKRWLDVVRAHLKPRSARTREVYLKTINATFGATPVRSITRTQCEDWAKLRSPEVASSTFNQETETLRAILDYAMREGVILDNPAKVIVRRKMGKATVLIPTREQFDKLVSTLRSLDIRYQAAADLIELLAFTGMRKAEANAFRLADVDFDRGSFVVTGGEAGTKNHEVRVVPLFPFLRDFLERLQMNAPAPLQPDTPLVSILDAKNALDTACKLNGFPHFTHHCLRHFFVSNAIEKGVDFKTIAAWIGHKDGGLLVAKTYGHLRDTHSFEMAKRMTL